MATCLLVAMVGILVHFDGKHIFDQQEVVMLLNLGTA